MIMSIALSQLVTSDGSGELDKSVEVVSRDFSPDPFNVVSVSLKTPNYLKAPAFPRKPF
jgi:hypothetical protein